MADRRVVFLAAMAAACAPAIAEDDVVDDEEEPVMDLEFLEYLGSWQESDEEWQLLDEAVLAQREAPPSEQPEEESPEANDES